jgi:hypothetical protein
MDDDVDASEPFANRVSHYGATLGRGYIRSYE